MKLDPSSKIAAFDQALETVNVSRESFGVAIEKARNLLQIHGPHDPLVIDAFKLVDGRRDELESAHRIAELNHVSLTMTVRVLELIG